MVILEHKSIICAGYSAVCHMHSVAEEVTVKLLICTVDKKTNEKSKNRPRFVKQDQVCTYYIKYYIIYYKPVCMEHLIALPTSLCIKILLKPRMFPVWDFVVGIFARKALLNSGRVLSTLSC